MKPARIPSKCSKPIKKLDTCTAAFPYKNCLKYLQIYLNSGLCIILVHYKAF